VAFLKMHVIIKSIKDRAGNVVCKWNGRLDT